jgi:Amt family ammonium transporter
MGFRKVPMPPHSMVLCMVGTGMLWVGWYGFNAGSALGADAISANAFTTTTLATAVAMLTWAVLEWSFRGEPSVLGFCTGAVAGLVVITPACGFITPGASVLVGVLAGAVPFFACTKIKNLFGYDDALDTFGVHGVGGTLGALLTGLLATSAVNPNLSANLGGILGRTLWLEQLKAMGFTIVLATVSTAVLAFGVKALIGLRPAPEQEEEGLDLAEHGEPGYHHE